MLYSTDVNEIRTTSNPNRSGILNRLIPGLGPPLSFRGNRVFRFLGYSLYTLLLLLLFLYLTFPYKQMEGRLISVLEQVLLSQIQVQESKWLYPLGLSWKGVSLQPQRGFKGDLLLDQARAEVYLLPLFSRRVETDFFVEAYGGNIRGSLLAQKNGGRTQYYLQETAQGIELKGVVLDIPFPLEGRLRMDLEAGWTEQDLIQGQGSGTLELSGVKTGRVLSGNWEFPGVTFSRIAASIRLRNGIVTVEQLNAQGVEMDAAGQGTLLLRKEIKESLINLALRVNLKQEFRQNFPLLSMMGSSRDPVEISVKGTLGRPLFSLNGVPLNL